MRPRLVRELSRLLGFKGTWSRAWRRAAGRLWRRPEGQRKLSEPGSGGLAAEGLTPRPPICLACSIFLFFAPLFHGILAPLTFRANGQTEPLPRLGAN